MTLSPIQKTRLGWIASGLTLVGGIALLLRGHPFLGTVSLILAGVAAGVVGPPTGTSGIHGGSDST